MDDTATTEPPKSRTIVTYKTDDYRIIMIRRFHISPEMKANIRDVIRFLASCFAIALIKYWLYLLGIIHDPK